MPRCKVCMHPDKGEIETLYLGGATPAEIEARYGIKPSSLWRHHRNHLDQRLVEPNPSTALAAAQDAANAFIEAVGFQRNLANDLGRALKAGEIGEAKKKARDIAWTAECYESHVRETIAATWQPKGRVSPATVVLPNW